MFVVRQSELVDVVVDIDEFDHLGAVGVAGLEGVFKGEARERKMFAYHSISNIFKLIFLYFEAMKYHHSSYFYMLHLLTLVLVYFLED